MSNLQKLINQVKTEFENSFLRNLLKVTPFKELFFYVSVIVWRLMNQKRPSITFYYYNIK